MVCLYPGFGVICGNRGMHGMVGGRHSQLYFNPCGRVPVIWRAQPAMSLARRFLT